MRVPITLSDRYVYFSQKDFEVLFGKNTVLSLKKSLVQPGQFLSSETVTLQGKLGSIDVVVRGPFKKHTQVIILARDREILGVDAPIQIPGNTQDSAGIMIIGPQGKIFLEKGLVVAKRHLHVTVAEAEEFGLTDGQIIKIKTGTKERGLIFDNVVVVVKDSYVLDFHLDSEEGNAAGIIPGAWGEIIQ